MLFEAGRAVFIKNLKIYEFKENKQGVRWKLYFNSFFITFAEHMVDKAILSVSQNHC